MLRWTVSLAVLVIVAGSTTDLMAQRRAPIRNLIRSIGAGWGSGHHSQNPGYDTSYYNSYSDMNNSYQYGDQGVISNGQIIDGQYFQAPMDGQIINQSTPMSPQVTPQTTPQASPNGVSPSPDDNSASRMLSPGSQQTIIRPIPSGSTATISDQQQVNQNMRPYHTNTSTSTSTQVQVNHGGNFQINPSQVPTGNTGWNTRYNQQFQNSQPFTPNR